MKRKIGAIPFIFLLCWLGYASHNYFLIYKFEGAMQTYMSDPSHQVKFSVKRVERWFLPYPRIILHGVRPVVDGNTEEEVVINAVDITLKPSALFTEDKIKDWTIYGLYAKTDHLLPILQSAVNTGLGPSSESKKYLLPPIKLQSSTIKQGDGSFEIEGLNADVTLASDLGISGAFACRGREYKSNILIRDLFSGKKDLQSTIKIQGQDLDISFVGNLSPFDKNMAIKGNINANFISENRTSKGSESMNIEAKIEASEGRLSLQGDVVQNKRYDTKGRIDIDLQKENIKLNLDIPHLDLDQLSGGNTKEEGQKCNLFRKYIMLAMENFSFASSVRLGTQGNVRISKITFNEQSTGLLSTSFYSDPDKGAIILKEFRISDMPGGSNLYAMGKMVYDPVKPQFNGEVQVDTSNASSFLNWMEQPIKSDIQQNGVMKVSSNVILVPYHIKMPNIKVQNSDFTSEGSLEFHLDLDHTLHIDGDFAVDRLNLDHFGLSKHVDALLLKFFTTNYDHTGTSHIESLSNYHWLRTLYCSCNAKLRADYLTYRGITMKDFGVHAHLSDNKIDIQNLSFSHNLAALKSGNFLFNVNPVVSDIGLDLKFYHYDTRFLSALMPSYNNMLKAHKEYHKNTIGKISKKGEEGNKGKKEEESKGGRDQKEESNLLLALLESDINFFSLYRYNMDFKFESDKVRFGPNGMSYGSEVAIDIYSRQKSAALRKFVGKLYGGEFKAKGQMNLDVQLPSFTVRYNLKGGELSQVLEPLGYNNLSGRISATGDLKSVGVNLDDMIKNLKGSCDWQAASVSWKSIDFEKNVNLPQRSIRGKELYSEATKNLTNGRTRFKKAHGQAKVANKSVVIKQAMAEGRDVKAAYNLDYDIVAKKLESNITLSSENLQGFPISFKIQSKGPVGDIKSTYDTRELLNSVFRSK